MPSTRVLALMLFATLIPPWAAGCAGEADGEALDCNAENLCEEVNRRYQDAIDEVVAQMNTCEVREDCTHAVPTLGCDAQATWLTTCAQGIRADAVQTFEQEVAALEPEFCDECDLECHHDDEFSCTAPIAKCIEGRCVVEFMEDVVPPG